MEVSASEIFPEVLIAKPTVFRDSRGFFRRDIPRGEYRPNGIKVNFVQDNVSCSRKGVLRGLHSQISRPPGKLVWVLKGEVFDVVVDLRLSFPTSGKWLGIILSSAHMRQL